LESGEKRTQIMYCVCPVKAKPHFPVSVHRNFIFIPLKDTICLPEGEKLYTIPPYR
jgi:hypothetical protein